MSEVALRIAAIGDVHGRWTDADRTWFDASSYDLLLFVGDIATHRHDGTEVVRNIATLNKPTLLLPGNHDGTSLPNLAAEAFGMRALFPLFALTQPVRRRRFADAAHPLALCGYCSHDIAAPWGKLTVIGARPHSMGGPRVAFTGILSRLYGVTDMTTSTAKLCALVDQASDDILFLAHNGPYGLGAARDDIWGCDFKKEPEDFGDEDLQLAIRHARTRGKRVRAVVAGHMHHTLRGGGERAWRVERDGTLYVNAARVPRIERRARRHHHVGLTLKAESATAEQVVISL